MAIACPACGTVLPGLSDPIRNTGGQQAAPSSAPYPLKPAGAPQVQYPSQPPSPGYAAPAPSPGWGASPRASSDAETHTYDPAQHAPPSPQGINNGATLHQPSPFQQGAPVGQHGPAASLVGRVKLVVEQGKILGEQFLLSDRQVIIGRYDAGSGRCPDIDLTAQDPAYVHRQHARLEFNGAGTEIMVYDMGGRNGSYVNNQLIARNGAATLHLGDKLRIGRVVLRLQTAPEVDKDHGKG
jgi:hypothetical protein